MSQGWQRVNARQHPPNERIVFIKPLEGPNKAVAENFLQRVAAICLPIMKKHYLSVVSLEEYEPNKEFVGRNFNAGEVIQLVLKSPSTGRWLPFRYVQMVMMHELAHCMQMNHSRAFWKVRNEYADELRALWDKNYSGDGLWGRGQSLYDGQYTVDAIPDLKDLPEHLCGGTYRSPRRRKRKRAADSQTQTLSYAERKQRRIAKKFGVQGQALGGDEDIKLSLEKGKKAKGAPRVAKSARGRELRAAAALARFEQNYAQPSRVDQTEDDTSSIKDEESGSEEDQDMVDKDGNRLLDSYGLIKVCENEDISDDIDARRELDELVQVRIHSNCSNGIRYPEIESSKGKQRSATKSLGETDNLPELIKKEDESDSRSGDIVGSSPATKPFSSKKAPEQKIGPIPRPSPSKDSSETVAKRACPVCSLENDRLALICAACSNVLNTSAVLNHWKCQNEACRNSLYINHGDTRLCALCGKPRPA